jgi:hypothetical protein
MNTLIKFITLITLLISPTWGSQFTHYIELGDLDNSGDALSLGGTANEYIGDIDVRGAWTAFSYNYKGTDPYKASGNLARFTRFDVPMQNGETQVIYIESTNFNQAGEPLVLKLEWVGNPSQTVSLDWNMTRRDDKRAYISLMNPVDTLIITPVEDSIMREGNISRFHSR